MVDVFFKKFGDPLKGADDGLNKSINETIAEIAREAKQLAPVKLGQLRGSIMYSGPEGDGWLMCIIVDIKKQVWEKCHNYGPEALRAHDWQVVNDE